MRGVESHGRGMLVSQLNNKPRGCVMPSRNQFYKNENFEEFCSVSFGCRKCAVLDGV
jgi:hypothetical protein